MSAAHGHIQIYYNVPQTRVHQEKNAHGTPYRHCDRQGIKTISLIDSFVIRQRCFHRKRLTYVLFSKSALTTLIPSTPSKDLSLLNPGGKLVLDQPHVLLAATKKSNSQRFPPSKGNSTLLPLVCAMCPVKARRRILRNNGTSHSLAETNSNVSTNTQSTANKTRGSQLLTPLVTVILMRFVPCTNHAEGSLGTTEQSHSLAETNSNVSTNTQSTANKNRGSQLCNRFMKNIEYKASYLSDT